MKIYIVRHGDKEKGNYYNEYLRHQDEPLNENGKRRAEKLVDYFENKQFSKIYVSEYLRTAQTAHPIAEKRGIQVIIDKRLNEIDNGLIDSLSDEEIKEKFPEFWDDFMSFSKDVRFPEGETGEEVKCRQKDLLNTLIENGEDVLLFGHEGYIRLLLCHLLGLPVYKRHLFKIDFCGITEIEYDKETDVWMITKVNHTLDI